jgi:hypothetical protein
MSDAEINELADSQFGDPSQINESRLLAGASDHCNGAQAALRGFKNKAKAAKKVEEMYGEVWQTMDTEERERALTMSLYGCQHHSRNIGFGRGHKAVEAHLQQLLKDNLHELKDKMVYCVGKADMTLRSIFKFFGNTTLLNYLSVGKEFRKWTAENCDYKDDEFQDCGRCDLGNRQDGISEHCFKMQTRTKKMLDFITEFHWSKTDNMYWPAIESSIDSEPLKVQRMLYALVFNQVRKPVHGFCPLILVLISGHPIASNCYRHGWCWQGCSWTLRGCSNRASSSGASLSAPHARWVQHAWTLSFLFCRCVFVWVCVCVCVHA